MNHTESFTFENRAQGRVHVKYPASQFASIPAYRRLFAEEALTGLKWNHPHILKYLKFNDEAEDFHIEMEYIPALTLHEALLEEPLGINTVRESRQIMDQLLDAVSYLHAQQVLHLDLRPENILVTRSAHDVKLINPASFYVGQPSYFIYKERYTAPELFAESSKPTVAADIYSLGRIMEYLFSYSTLTAGVSKVIARATADDPKKRFPSVEAMRQALQRSRRVDRIWKGAKIVAALIVLVFIYQMFTDDRVPTDIVPPTADSTYSRRAHVPPSNQTEDNDDLYRLSTMQEQLDAAAQRRLQADTLMEKTPEEKALAAETEALFKKEFRKRAEAVIAKIYTSKMMNGDERQFLKASSEASNELDRIQRQMSEEFGMDLILTTRLSSEVITELTAEYLKKINLPVK
jgi:hypothetical protein